MSKKIITILTALAIIMSLMSFQAVANSQDIDIVVKIDGEVVNFPDAKPFINEDSRTLCPIRFIAENLGADVEWNGGAKTVLITKESTEILLTIGDNTAIVNGTEKTFDTVPQIFENRTYVPLRFISETFNMDVDWDGETKTVLISTPFDDSLTLPEHFDKYLSEMEKNRGLSGAILIAKDDEILFSKGYGYANIEKKIKNAPNTKFAIGELTKTFTAMAIMQLYEKGLLDLDDAISKYIPGVVEGDNITIKHLLTHTSGLINYTDLLLEMEEVPEDTSIDFVLGLFKDEPLIFEPGTQWVYNNSGYVLLGCVVEKVSELSFDEYLKENIFKPLEMNDTGTYYDKMEEDYAVGYVGITELTPVEADEILLKIAYGAGNILSTVNDMYKWDRALQTEKLVKKETLDMIFDIQEKMPESEVYTFDGYGFGWFIENNPELGKIVSHGGNTLSYSAQLSKYVDKDITIIITTNAGNYFLDTIDKTLVDIILGNSYELPEDLVEIELDAEILKKYTGIYEHIEGYNIVILESEGQLYAQLPGQVKAEIYPKSQTEFFYKVIDAKITFKTDDNGKIIGLVFEQGNTILETTRVGDAPQREIADINKEIYKKYVGEYEIENIGIITVSVEDEKLYARLTGQVKLEILPMSETEFFYKDIQAEIEFVVANDGTVKGLVLKQEGLMFMAKKI